MRARTEEQQRADWEHLIASTLSNLHKQVATPEGVRQLDRDYEPDWSGVIAAVENGCTGQEVYQELHKVLEPIATSIADSEWEQH